MQALVPGDQFGLIYYAQGQQLAILYPFALAHPRLALALRFLPFAIGVMVALMVVSALLLLAARRVRERRTGRSAA